MILAEDSSSLQSNVILSPNREHSMLFRKLFKLMSQFQALSSRPFLTRASKLTPPRTLADLKNKITSFSHKGYNQPYFLDTGRLLRHVRGGEDLFERETQFYDRIDDNPDVPAYLQNNETREKFDYMLNRDPWHANFHDLKQT